MDAVELARQKAAGLHLLAIQQGLDPWKPYEFAVAIARQQGYDVEHAVPGASMLDGGRAKLLPSDELILHELRGTRFEQALLVAHEVGHALLGDAEDSTPSKDMDFARPAEAAPVGEDRVVDYGRRQRREVQMDLFARELLIPRAHVRAQHLQQGLTARDLACRLDAPYEIVAQQLLDALLLPEVTATDKQAKDHGLNPSQLAAARHRGCAFLVAAGPGTGKTQTLISRVEELLLQDKVDPRRILLLTFSNKAAGEMADRIAGKQPEAAAALWVGTFHAFGLDLIRRFHEALDLPKDPRLIDRTEAVELLEHEFPQLGLQHYQDLYDPTLVIYDMLAAISRAKDEVVGPEDYMRLAQAMRASAISDEQKLAAAKALEVARVYAKYEELKRGRNCVDFGDLVYLPVKLLEGDENVRQHLSQLYDHILVDEYQDVNRSSVRLLKALRPSGENLWVVGDAKQSIYRFRGASSFNISRFGKEDFPGGKIGKLDTNYRSVPAIVKAYSSFATQMRAGGPGSELEAHRSDADAPPEFRLAPDASEQTVAVADGIEELKCAGIAYRDQAVLSTGNEKLASLGRDLESLGIPVLFLGSLFERPEVKDLLSLVSLLIDPRAMGLVRVACMPDFQMPISEVAAIQRELRAQKVEPLAFLTRNIAGLSDEGVAALKNLAALFDGLKATDPPWHVLASILLDRTHIAAGIASAQTISDRARGIAIWQFMNFVRVQPAAAGLPVFRLLERVRRLLRLGDDRELRQLPAAAQGIDAVRLMTIHGAKGLEFRAVHVPGLNQDTLPGNKQRAPACPPPEGMVEGATGTYEEFRETSRLEERECLFYVAMSRAKDRLILYAAAANKGGRQRKVSEEYLARLGTGLARKTVTPARQLPPAPEEVPIELRVQGKLRFDAHQLELFARCPRRFFYTHVLQTGGKRTVTPFIQMHDGVRKLFKKVVKGELNSTGEQLAEQVAQALRDEGLGEHGYFNHYKDFAVAMIEFFASTREGLQAREPQALHVSYAGEEIVVTPDDMLVAPDGSITLRRVSTGHSRSEDAKSISAAAFLSAAAEAFPGATVELVSLADRQSTLVSLKTGEIATRRGYIESHLRAIRAGEFPSDPSSFSCPNCPALFICGPVPSGPLEIHLQVAGAGTGGPDK
jgi:superfamily I DNA/RNA helicase